MGWGAPEERYLYQTRWKTLKNFSINREHYKSLPKK